ncbi:MAG: RecX family transcriptional regulator, partial [Gaiellaceae bacterium]
ELDGVPWRTLPLEAVARAGVAVGRELDRAAARRLRRELRQAEALAVAGRSLRTRDQSTRRLLERLERANVSPAARDEAVNTLTRVGVVDDARFASARARALAERGYGDSAITADLERQGVPGELWPLALANLQPEAERAGRVVQRRGRGPGTARFLAAKGFSQEALEAALAADFANGP